MGHRVCRAADLEGADRLQVLELEIDLSGRVSDVQADQRRADRGARDRTSRVIDVSQ